MQCTLLKPYWKPYYHFAQTINQTKWRLRENAGKFFFPLHICCTTRIKSETVAVIYTYLFVFFSAAYRSICNKHNPRKCFAVQYFLYFYYYDTYFDKHRIFFTELLHIYVQDDQHTAHVSSFLIVTMFSINFFKHDIFLLKKKKKYEKT